MSTHGERGEAQAPRALKASPCCGPRVGFLLPSARFLLTHWDRKPPCGTRTLWGHRETSRAFGSRWAKAQMLVLPYPQRLDVGNLHNHWAWPKLIKLHSQNECLLVCKFYLKLILWKKEKSQITSLFCSKPCHDLAFALTLAFLWPPVPFTVGTISSTVQPHLLSSSVRPRQATTLHLRAFALLFHLPGMLPPSGHITPSSPEVYAQVPFSQEEPSWQSYLKLHHLSPSWTSSIHSLQCADPSLPAGGIINWDSHLEGQFGIAYWNIRWAYPTTQ